MELALFVSAFLAATILPLSSEVAFVAAISNDMEINSALIYATSGNVLAIILNYFLGFWLYDKTKTKLKSSKIGRKSLLYGHKYGVVALFLSWLPIIGDPITLVAGIFRINFLLFVLIAGSARFLRYYFLTFVI